MNKKRLLLKSGWVIVSEKKQKTLDMENLLLCEFVTSSEEYVTWDMMLNKAKLMDAYGSQDTAEHFLKIQSNVPDEWRKYNIIFPNTVWKSVTGHKLCPYLYFKDDKWELDYYWFLYDFHHNDRFLVVSGRVSSTELKL